MSFFPGSLVASAPASDRTSFHPLFRLLDDFEQHTQNSKSDATIESRSGRHVMKTFTPKFDVKEVENAYELHGDLPGIEQTNVEIEFTDIQTITIRGRTERSYTSSNATAAGTEGSGGESHPAKAHKATVEDEDGVVVATPQKSTEVSKSTAAPKQPEAKYWVSERSVGEFSRSFTFPVRVDQDAVTASMKNGVLTVVVPKAKKHEARKITIT
ncbi:uncharacterized protein L3040_009078 [Drepanopeziza brunnea f. sp. 'multigermtubi']|nr:hypothetical protein L3040_009078 [Drepanopeziza brunnea f. sp. 'multigermtubi']